MCPYSECCLGLCLVIWVIMPVKRPFLFKVETSPGLHLTKHTRLSNNSQKSKSNGTSVSNLQSLILTIVVQVWAGDDVIDWLPVNLWRMSIHFLLNVQQAARKLFALIRCKFKNPCCLGAISGCDTDRYKGNYLFFFTLSQCASNRACPPQPK